MSPHRVPTLAPPLTLASYGISDNGFLPEDEPLAILPHAYYQPWESIVQHLPKLVETDVLRARVDGLPILLTSYLSSEPEWQRAYSILTFLAQAYIWSGTRPSEHLPPGISVPLLQVSSHLRVQPVASYAGLNLWNWKRRNEEADITNPDNLATLQTITATEDESWFYLVSVAMEARAASLISMMLSTLGAAEFEDAVSVTASLSSFAQSLSEIGQLLERMDERCRPQVFYHHIRPFLAGSINMEAAGLTKGVFYDEGDGRGRWMKLRGGSNGQSSLIQFCDVILGVEHFDKMHFHQEMRKYMPGPHAQFLEDLECNLNIRQYVASHQEDKALVAAYDAAIAMLCDFRNKHIQLVSRYIIVPSRTPRHDVQLAKKNLAVASAHIGPGGSYIQELVGTGGTKLVPFLRGSRDETAATAMALQRSK